jgi:hypothetical protein
MAETTVAVVADSDEDLAAYLQLGPPEDYVVVYTAADVPARLGGMANLRQDELEPELRDALARALGVTTWPAP